MPYVMPRLVYVSATDSTASWSSISAALRHANPGDTVVVGPGRYAPSTTGEHFPLYVPPGVSLSGAGQDATIIDGEHAMDLSFRPVRAEQSLVLLGDVTCLSGCTLTNSGGNGVGNQPGARILIERNTISQHGQHGIILSGPQEAVISNNRLLNNGTRQFRPETPRPAAGRQGHHIFVQGKGGAANSILISDNTMHGAFADAIAMVVFFDEPDATGMHIRVLNNQIVRSERRGLTIAGSFGPQQTRVRIEVRHNVIRETAQAIAAQAARPLVTHLVRDCHLQLYIADNECHDNPAGIALFGGFGPAAHNLLDCTVLGNHLTGITHHAVRIIGGVGFGGYAAHHNQVRAVIGRNRIEAADDAPIFLQGGTRERDEEVSGNLVLAQITDNDLPVVSGKPRILVNDGLAGNRVDLEETTTAYERTRWPMPYQA